LEGRWSWCLIRMRLWTDRMEVRKKMSMVFLRHEWRKQTHSWYVGGDKRKEREKKKERKRNFYLFLIPFCEGYFASYRSEEDCERHHLHLCQSHSNYHWRITSLFSFSLLSFLSLSCEKNPLIFCLDLANQLDVGRGHFHFFLCGREHSAVQNPSHHSHRMLKCLWPTTLTTDDAIQRHRPSSKINVLFLFSWVIFLFEGKKEVMFWVLG